MSFKRPHPPPSPDHAFTTANLRWSPWFFVLLASFFLVTLFGWHLINDADLGFHLRSGQWILENHRVPFTDAFTYTVPSHHYVDMEWLYQTVLYLLYRIGGYGFLSWVHITLALMAFAILWVHLRATGSPYWMAVSVFMVAVLASEPRFRVRPEILAWVFLALVLWILDRRWSGKRDLLFLLPLIQLFWVNTEGLFFLGPAVMGAYLLSGWVHSLRADPKLFKYFFLSIALCLANPYFLQGAFFPFSFLSSLGSSDVFKYTVQEFQPPWTFVPAPWAPVPSYLWVYKGFCLWLLFILIASAKHRKAHEWILTSFFFLLSMTAVRNIPLFLIATGPIAVVSWEDLKMTWLQKFQVAFLSTSWTAGLLVLFLAGFSARVVTNAHYVSNRLTDRFGLGLDTDSLPDRACQFLSENRLDGKIVNDLDDGDWLDWRGSQKTFLDGRLDVMGTGFYIQYVQSQAPDGLEKILLQYQPQIILFNPILAPQWASDLKGRPDWRLVYLDSLNAVYLRQGYEDRIPALDFGKLLASNGLSNSLLSQASSLLGEEPPSPWGIERRGYFQSVDYPNGLLNLAIFCSYTGHPEASEAFFLEAIRRSQGRYADLYYDLGLLYLSTQRQGLAALCMKQVLRDKPDDPIARQIVGLPPNS